MKLLDSLLDAIVRLEGDALVMHVGEKPYVVTASSSMNAYRGPLAWGQVELSSRVLTFDAVSSMLVQILPAHQQQALTEFGAIEHEIPSPAGVADRFTVIAARGGEDVWLEVRRKPIEIPEIPAGAVDMPPPVDAPAEAVAAQPVNGSGAGVVASAPGAVVIEPIHADEPPATVPVETPVDAVPDAPETDLESHEIELVTYHDDERPEADVSLETIESIVVAIPGQAVEEIELNAVPDDAIQIIDEEAQHLPTEAEVDAMLASTATALLTSGLGEEPVASSSPVDEIVISDEDVHAYVPADEPTFELSPPPLALPVEEDAPADGAVAAEAPAGTPLFSEEAALTAAASPVAEVLLVDAPVIAVTSAEAAADEVPATQALVEELPVEQEQIAQAPVVEDPPAIAEVTASEQPVVAAEPQPEPEVVESPPVGDAWQVVADQAPPVETWQVVEPPPVVETWQLAEQPPAFDTWPVDEQAPVFETWSVVEPPPVAEQWQDAGAPPIADTWPAAEPPAIADTWQFAEPPPVNDTWQVTEQPPPVAETWPMAEQPVAEQPVVAETWPEAESPEVPDSWQLPDEPPIVEAWQTVEPPPVVEMWQAAEPTPIVELWQTSEPAPVVESWQAAEPPHAESWPVADQPSIDQTWHPADHSAIVETWPLADQEPVVESAATPEDVAPVAETWPVDEQAPIGEHAPVAEVVFVAPVAEIVPVVAATPGVDVVTDVVTEDAPVAVEAEPVAELTPVVDEPAMEQPHVEAADLLPDVPAFEHAWTRAADLEVVNTLSEGLAQAVEEPTPPASTPSVAEIPMEVSPELSQEPVVETAEPAAASIELASPEMSPSMEADVHVMAEDETRQAVVVPLARTPIKPEFVSVPFTPSEDAALMHTLRVAAARGASTVYVVAQSKPMIRIDGEIGPLESEPVLTAADVDRLVMELAPPRRRDALQNGPVEWLCDVPEIGRVRCQTFRDHRGPGILFRMFPPRAISADQLGLTPEVQALCQQSDGLVLVTGARASGKSTLLNAFVDLINRTRSDHVITIESQIGFVHESRRSFISQRESRGDAELAATYARAALREDPDVMMIEDLKSADLVSAALEAAESGRLVLASVPASSTIGALERLIEVFPADQRAKARTSLATALRGVVAQVLLRRIKGGRVAAREILLNTPAVSTLILEGKMFQLPVALDSGRRHGMVPLTDSLAGQVRDGTVHVAEAYRKALDRAALVALLKREGIDTSFAERLA